MKEATHHLQNDSPSFHPVQPLIRAVGLQIYTTERDAALLRMEMVGPNTSIQSQIAAR